MHADLRLFSRIRQGYLRSLRTLVPLSPRQYSFFRFLSLFFLVRYSLLYLLYDAFSIFAINAFFTLSFSFFFFIFLFLSLSFSHSVNAFVDSFFFSLSSLDQG